MAILTPQTLGAVFSGSAYNNNLLLIEGSLLDIGPYVISGLVPSVGTGLSVDVTAGTASIGGQVSVGAFSIGGLAPSTTNHLYLLNTGAGTSNTTGTAPANSCKLGTALTGVATVTSVDTSTASGRQEKGVAAANVFLKDADQTLSDGTDIAVGTGSGTKIGTSTSQKLGFFNAAPVAQPAALTQTYSTADATLSAYTSDPESSSYTGIDNLQIGTPYAAVADLNQLRVAYENLRLFTEDLAAFTNSLIDKLQSLGLVG